MPVLMPSDGAAGTMDELQTRLATCYGLVREAIPHLLETGYATEATVEVVDGRYIALTVLLVPGTTIEGYRAGGLDMEGLVVSIARGCGAGEQWVIADEAVPSLQANWFFDELTPRSVIIARPGPPAAGPR